MTDLARPQAPTADLARATAALPAAVERPRSTPLRAVDDPRIERAAQSRKAAARDDAPVAPRATPLHAERGLRPLHEALPVALATRARPAPSVERAGPSVETHARPAAAPELAAPSSPWRRSDGQHERAASADDDRVIRPTFGRAETKPRDPTRDPAPVPVSGFVARPISAAESAPVHPRVALPDNVVPFPARPQRAPGDPGAVDAPRASASREQPTFERSPHRSLLDAVMELHPDRETPPVEASSALPLGAEPSRYTPDAPTLERPPELAPREAFERPPADEALPREWSVRVDDEVTVQVTVEGRDVSVHVEATERASGSLEGLQAELSSDLSQGGHHLAEYLAERRGRPGRFERAATGLGGDEPEPPASPVGRGHSVNRVV